MGPEAHALLDIAASISDGVPVDWVEAEATASDDRTRRSVRQLRLLSTLAEAHRTIAFDEAGSARTGTGRDAGVSASAEALTSWGGLELRERLGQGSYGEVYRAFDPKLQRDVAVKLLHPDRAQGEQTGRILAEGRSLARVQHPHVVSVYGADECDGRPGLWMEFVRGRTLEQQLRTSDLFTAVEAAAIGRQLCQALAAVHAAGLVHRDVKPQNVMREPGGRVVLMDFGAGQPNDPAGGTSRAGAGTPLYSAPEVLDGEAATPRSDVYSLGVLLYHLVTGTYPVRAATLTDMRAAHAARRVHALRDARPGLPPAFVQAVNRALAHDPADRFDSAAAFEQALDAAVRPGLGGWKIWGLCLAVVVAVSAGLVALVPSMRPSFLTGPSPPAIRSIAVLPLQNRSGEPDYFVDGVTEGLISELGRLRALHVTSRASSMRYKGTSKAVPAITGELGVHAVVSGSILRSGDTLHLSLELILGSSDRHVWSREFERPISNVAQLQADVTQAIADFVGIPIEPGERAALNAKQTVNPQAYTEYLRGRHYWSAFSADDMTRAVAYFRAALQIDPNYAAAFAGLGDAYAQMGGSFRTLGSHDALTLATAAAERAIGLEPANAEAYATLGFARYYLGWDWDAAERAFLSALQINPGHAGAHNMYANLLTATGRPDAAIEHARIAEARDPLSPMMARDVAWHYFFARQYDDGVAQLQKTLALHPDFVPALTLLGRTYSQKGMHDEAIGALRRAVAEQPDLSVAALLGQVLAAAGRVDEARAILLRVSGGADRANRAAPYLIALIHAALQQPEDALAWLGRSVDEHDAMLVVAQVDPRLERLRADPRFASLMGRAGFPIVRP